MIYLDVLYKDLQVVTCPIDDVGTAPKDDVLFLRLRTDKREGKYGVISVCHGFDNYALMHRQDRGDNWYMLFGWDEDDYVWRRECNDCVNREPVDAPVSYMHVIFRGGAVSQEGWKKAEKVIAGM